MIKDLCTYSEEIILLATKNSKNYIKITKPITASLCLESKIGADSNVNELTFVFKL